MGVSNIRQLDIWAANKNPNDIQYPLDTILERITEKRKNGENVEPLNVLVNCVSKFTIGDREIERHIGTLIFSKQLDVAFCIMNNSQKDGEYKGQMVDAREAAKFFEENNITYDLSFGDYMGYQDENTDVPETWFIREGYVFNEFLNDSINHGCTECIVYPDIKARITVGQYSYWTGDFCVAWEVNFERLVTTKSGWALMTNEGYPTNIKTTEEITDMLKEKGFSYTIGENPYDEIKKK